MTDSIDASELVKISLLNYSKEVIEGRAVPDFRDGLKISQRRFLYYMASQGITSDKNYKSTADVVGGVLGKLHPHGDQSLHETAVTLVNSTISPIDGHGGWGSLIGEASAMRYTKLKLSSFGDFFTRDRHVAEYMPNYTGEWEEPLIIPAPIPYCLVSGAGGIAVAVTSHIPCHNLTELVNAFIVILNGTTDIEEIVGPILKGPDSFYGGVLVSTLPEIQNLYRTGAGGLTWRCQYQIEYEEGEGEWSLIITGVPEGFNITKWLSDMTEYANNGKVLSISNECSQDDPIRFVLKFNNHAFFEELIEPSLYFKKNYCFNLVTNKVSSGNGLSLKKYNFLEWVESWLDWREGIEISLVNSLLENLNSSLLRESTKLLGSEHIDDIIALLKKSTNPLQDLIAKFKITEEQAIIISDMPLKSISKLSKDRQKETIRQIEEQIKIEKAKLKNPKLLIEHTLRSLLQFDRVKRSSKIDYGEKRGEKTLKSLSESEGKPSYWGVAHDRPSSIALFGPDVPLRKSKTHIPYISLVNTSSGVLIISKKGIIDFSTLSKLQEGDLRIGEIVGLLPAVFEQFIICCNNGLCGNYECKPFSKWDCKLLKGPEDEILSVVGINTGDILWVWNNEEFMSYKNFNLNSMIHANRSGWRGIENSRGRRDNKLLVIPKEHSLIFSDTEDEYPFKDLATPSNRLIDIFKKSEGKYFLCNPKSDIKNLLVIDKNCSRYFMSGKGLIDADLDVVKVYYI